MPDLVLGGFFCFVFMGFFLTVFSVIQNFGIKIMFSMNSIFFPNSVNCFPFSVSLKTGDSSLHVCTHGDSLDCFEIKQHITLIIPSKSLDTFRCLYKFHLPTFKILVVMQIGACISFGLSMYTIQDPNNLAQIYFEVSLSFTCPTLQGRKKVGLDVWRNQLIRDWSLGGVWWTPPIWWSEALFIRDLGSQNDHNYWSLHV